MVQRLNDWTASNCTLSTVTEQGISFLRVTRTGNNPYIQSPTGRGVNGKLYRQARALVRKSGGSPVATSFVGRLSWGTTGDAAHGISSSYKDEISAPSGKALGEWFDLLWSPGDTPTAGGTDWVDADTIDRIRLEFSNDSGAVWDLLNFSEGAYGAAPFADTPNLLPNAATKVSADSASGPFLLPKKNLTPPNNYVVIHDVTLTTSGEGELVVDWFATCDYGHGDYGYFSLMVDGTPTYDGAGVINNANRQNKYRGNNTLQMPVGLRHVVTGLAAGSHTIKLLGQQDNNTPQHSIRDCVMTFQEMKR